MSTHLGFTRTEWQAYFKAHPWPAEYAASEARMHRRTFAGFRPVERKHRMRALNKRKRRKMKDTWLQDDAPEFESKWTK